MKTINLKLYLMLSIVIIAITCLLAISFFTLYQAANQSNVKTLESAISLEKQLKTQIIRTSIAYGHPSQFPNFNLWKESEQKARLCARFSNPEGKVKKNSLPWW